MIFRKRIESNPLLRKVFVGTPWRGVYASFDEAQAEIPAGKSIGYNSQEAAEIFRTYPILRKRPTDYVTTFHLQALLKPGARIFDFGGNVGIAYYVNRQYLVLPENLYWLVCDVPTIVAVGRERASVERAKGLAFTTDFGDADGADVLLTSGSLQFVKESLAEKLEVLKAPPPYLLINRIPVWEGEHYYTVHQIGDFFCPYQVFNQQEFVASLTRLGYRLVDHWECPESSLSIRLKPERRLRNYQGFYLVRDGFPVETVRGQHGRAGAENGDL